MAAPRPGIPASLRAPASAWESKPLLINDPDDDANALVISSGVSDIVGVYVPVGRKGLAGQGAVTEGDVDAGAVKLLYHFLLMVGWLEQPVWKPRGAVLVLRRPRRADESVECYRADDDAVTGLVFLAHSAPVEYPKPKKRGGGGGYDEAEDEVDLRTLPQQMNLNAAEHFRLATHASPIALMDGSGPPASKRARGAVDLSGVFHPTLEAKGIHMLTIDCPSAFDKASQYLFPTLRHSTRSSLAESPACTWSLPSLLSRVRRCHHGGGQVVDFFEETFSEVSSVRLRSGQPNEEVDVYVVERAFWKINSSFMTVIPRAFRPPLEPALILRYYAMLHHYNPVSRPFCSMRGDSFSVREIMQASRSVRLEAFILSPYTLQKNHSISFSNSLHVVLKVLPRKTNKLICRTTTRSPRALGACTLIHPATRATQVGDHFLLDEKSPEEEIYYAAFRSTYGHAEPASPDFVAPRVPIDQSSVIPFFAAASHSDRDFFIKSRWPSPLPGPVHEGELTKTIADWLLACYSDPFTPTGFRSRLMVLVRESRPLIAENAAATTRAAMQALWRVMDAKSPAQGPLVSAAAEAFLATCTIYTTGPKPHLVMYGMPGTGKGVVINTVQAVTECTVADKPTAGVMQEYGRFMQGKVWTTEEFPPDLRADAGGKFVTGVKEAGRNACINVLDDNAEARSRLVQDTETNNWGIDSPPAAMPKCVMISCVNKRKDIDDAGMSRFCVINTYRQPTDRLAAARQQEKKVMRTENYQSAAFQDLILSNIHAVLLGALVELRMVPPPGANWVRQVHPNIMMVYENFAPFKPQITSRFLDRFMAAFQYGIVSHAAVQKSAVDLVRKRAEQSRARLDHEPAVEPGMGGWHLATASKSRLPPPNIPDRPPTCLG